MFRNYVKLAFRNLTKNKINSLVHVFGLTIGLTGCFLIGLFVLDELKFDQFHPDSERIYRIITERGGASAGEKWASSSPAFAPALAAEYPEIETATRVFRIRQKQLFEKGETKMLEEKGIFAEPIFLNIFHLPLKYGDPETALNEINNMVLTEELAQKYFGDENPIGQSITINEKQRKITGVLQSLSPYFHLDFNFIVAFENLKSQVSEARINSWVWQDFFTYVKFFPHTDIDRFEEKLIAFTEKNAHPQTKEHGFYYTPHLQNLEDIYLHSSQLQNDMARRGNNQYVMGLSLVGLFLLFIASINFINLTTARAIHRAKEVGIRKTAGAVRSQLTLQFITEAILIVGISVLIAAALTQVLLPSLNAFTEKALVFDWYKDPIIIMTLLGIIVITGLFAGTYPAFVLSGFRPVDALKGSKVPTAGHIHWLRKGLVTMQFTLSIILIISVLVIYQQVNFLGQKDLGFNEDQLMHFPMKNKLYNNFETTKAAFLNVPGVKSASTCFGIPADIISGDNVILPEDDSKSVPARIFAVDHEYIPTMGMELAAGRNFAKAMTTDSTEAFIINETAMRTFGIADSPEAAIGKPLHWEGWDDDRTIKKGKVIGVIKDFHYNSLHEKVEPSVLHIYPNAYWKLALKLDGTDLRQTIAGIENTWAEFNTGFPIDYQFVDEDLGAMYQSEQKLNSLFWIFTLLAIVISCLGTFGLAAYAAIQRRKEIGIRKVLGASNESIVYLMSKDFLKLVVVAIVIASPIAFYFLNGWLDNFAYRIYIQWWVFVAAGAAAILIAFLTVSLHSIKAATSNPINSLRTE